MNHPQRASPSEPSSRLSVLVHLLLKFWSLFHHFALSTRAAHFVSCRVFALRLLYPLVLFFCFFSFSLSCLCYLILGCRPSDFSPALISGPLFNLIVSARSVAILEPAHYSAHKQRLAIDLRYRASLTAAFAVSRILLDTGASPLGDTCIRATPKPAG